jgi:hypothetical protein
MIRKPPGSAYERESVGHAAVARAAQIGEEVRTGARRTGYAVSGTFMVLWLGMMAFGLLMSGTPAWFKLPGLIGFGALIRYVHRRTKAKLHG